MDKIEIMRDLATYEINFADASNFGNIVSGALTTMTRIKYKLDIISSFKNMQNMNSLEANRSMLVTTEHENKAK